MGSRPRLVALSPSDDVGRVRVLHADDMVAGIDMMHFAGDAARQVGEK